jgi:ABC-2 type transport system permease protein
MRKVWTVAVREYNATVRTKAFLIGLLFTPIMWGGALIGQRLTEGITDTKERRFAVIDRTPKQALYPRLAAAVEERNARGAEAAAAGRPQKSRLILEPVEPSPPDPEAVLRQRYELSERVRRKDLYGFVEIGADVLHGRAGRPAAADEGRRRRGPQGELADQLVVRYHSNNPLNRDLPDVAERVLNDAIQRHRWERVQITEPAGDATLARDAQGGKPTATSYERAQEIARVVPLFQKGLAKLNPSTGGVEDGADVNFLTAFFVPFGIMMLMFMMIMSAAPLMQSVVEEKSQRIAEVLLGSVRPFELMLGKLVGMVGVTLTLAAVYLGVAYWAAYHFGFANYLPPGTIAWFLLYQVLAVLMYGSMFIAIGAACTTTQETQSLLMPVMMVACIPLFVSVHVVMEPNSAVSTAFSFFPPATPMLMVTRQAIPPGVPAWQPWVGVAVVLAATLACVYAAGRIFRVGLLMQGKAAKPGELLRWIVRA